MQAIITGLQNIGIFIVFLATRFAILLVVLAALTVVFLAGLAVVRLVQGARRRALNLSHVAGLTWRGGVYYGPGHAWLQWRGAEALRVGLDDLAQHVLARITEVTLPQPGQLLKVGEAAAVVRCGKRRAVIPSPVEGRVVSINKGVLSRPTKLHTDPYSAGWLYAIEPTDNAYTRLPYGAESKTWFSNEAHRFSEFLEHQLGLAAADGGELVAPGPSLLTDGQWDEMTRSFLQSPR